MTEAFRWSRRWRSRSVDYPAVQAWTWHDRKPGFVILTLASGEQREHPATELRVWRTVTRGRARSLLYGKKRPVTVEEWAPFGSVYGSQAKPR